MMFDFEIVTKLAGTWCVIGATETLLLIAVCWIAVNIIHALSLDGIAETAEEARAVP